MIHFTCSGCGKPCKASEDSAGRKARCKRCGQTLQIPTTPSPKSEDTVSEQLALPQLESYDSSNAQTLLTLLGQISTFSQVSTWDTAAELEVSRIRAYLGRMQVYDRELNDVERRAKETHAQKGIFVRTFGSYQYRSELS